ncbi:PLP-dependent aminotransferase family protein [Roseateles sp. DAIF2]|uniref:aminotransferase-like domain-containing protein n=1 Tax=Roseateles sp. DAIF2 TaxID=2714952 RepID=UPI0018A2E948|nr:PLP-dependent aminotransferase family protein [Roseateles sp. DAIF2]QPF71617.1 PLP-dependent aminotransferase family protein [Roseateles sp. DAIF2]
MPRARYQTLVDEFSHRIQSGELRPGAQLPTVRALMQRQGVALATAARVYRTLESAGLVVGEAGRGTFVRDTSLPRSHGPLAQQPGGGEGLVDLSFNYPALPGQAELLREGLRGLAGSGDLDALLHAAPQGGRPHERASAARHLRNRGIRVPADQVLIVNGAQQGLALAALALLRPGELLAVDALTYPGIRALAAAHRLELAALPLREGQTDLDALATLCRRRRVRAVYSMPTLHNPLGSVMGLAERQRLVALAERHELLIIEDGAYAFLAEPAPPPLFILAPRRCIYVSGLSKSVASGLRIGFVAAPPALVPALEQAQRASTWNTPSIAVALACRWIEAGTVDALEDAKRRDARQRQRLARRVLRGCRLSGHPGAYYLWLELPAELRAEQVVAELRQAGVLLSSAEPFAATAHVPQALRVALGSVPLDILELALGRVRAALQP